jgi:glycosyltransferase involved in cell wall biosynthesis
MPSSAESPGAAPLKPTYISWAPHCSRSDNTARELGGRSHMVYWGALGSSMLTVWLKYLGQAIRTFRILSQDRPEVVFVMTPPVFAVATVWLWCALHRVPYVVDAHTAAFAHARWKHLLWLHDALCRRALTTIVTNDHLAERVRAAGAHATIVRDVPIEYPQDDSFRPAGAFTVAVVCSFNYDEPIEQILGAAAQLPGVQFYMTGRPKGQHKSLAIPSNVTLTGFLSTEAYGSLLARSDVVLTLTTRDHTMLRGAYEAVYQGTPVIVSDSPLLRRAFDRGAIHVNNTAVAIAEAVGEMRRRHADYKADVLLLRESKYETWEETKSALLSHLSRRATGGPRARRQPASARPACTDVAAETQRTR